jgi:hypothetical protein
MDKTILRFRFLIIASLFVLIPLAMELGSSKQPLQAGVELPPLAETPTYTMVPTVTGWPSQTPTITPTAILPGTPAPTPTETSYPGPPILISPPDGALMPQPVPPEEWYFKFQPCYPPTWCGIDITGPGGRQISALVDSGEYRYITDTYLPEDALGPWFWGVWICRQLGCNHSETRAFWVHSNNIGSEIRLYLPSVVQGAPLR